MLLLCWTCRLNFRKLLQYAQVKRTLNVLSLGQKWGHAAPTPCCSPESQHALRKDLFSRSLPQSLQCTNQVPFHIGTISNFPSTFLSTISLCLSLSVSLAVYKVRVCLARFPFFRRNYNANRCEKNI